MHRGLRPRCITTSVDALGLACYKADLENVNVNVNVNVSVNVGANVSVDASMTSMHRCDASMHRIDASALTLGLGP